MFLLIFTGFRRKSQLTKDHCSSLWNFFSFLLLLVIDSLCAVLCCAAQLCCCFSSELCCSRVTQPFTARRKPVALKPFFLVLKSFVKIVKFLESIVVKVKNCQVPYQNVTNCFAALVSWWANQAYMVLPLKQHQCLVQMTGSISSKVRITFGQ